MLSNASSLIEINEIPNTYILKTNEKKLRYSKVNSRKLIDIDNIVICRLYFHSLHLFYCLPSHRTHKQLLVYFFFNDSSIAYSIRFQSKISNSLEKLHTYQHKKKINIHYTLYSILYNVTMETKSRFTDVKLFIFKRISTIALHNDSLFKYKI